MFLGLDPELAIVGRAANGAEAVRLAHELLPDVVLMDLLMPVMDGITATTIIRRELPEVEVVALTSVLDDDKVIGAIRAGAIGYLLKDTEADELRRAIKAAAAGQVQLSPQVVERLLREVKPPDSPRLGLSLIHILVVVLIGGAFLLWAINRTAAEEPRPTPAVAQSTTTAPAAQPTSTLAAPVAAPTGNGTLMAVVAPVTVTTSATCLLYTSRCV